MDFLTELGNRTLILDGAMGTQLMAAGYRSVECPEEWNVSRSDVVSDIHRAYLAAGADIIETNTFGGNGAKLGAYHAADRVEELNLAAARLACAARDEAAPDRLVAGDVSSSGKMLKPLGDTDPHELRDVFAEQAEALVKGGVDLLVIETMFDLEEARAAVLGARAVTRSLPIVATMAFKPSPRGYHTMMGVTPAQAAEALLGAGADVVGANCEITAEDMVGIVAEFRAATDAPLAIQPNAGQPRLSEGHTVYGETPERFASYMPAIVAGGASLVGGCCGTTPAHIAALVAEVRG
jgi:5-methyltetrahydrofolate--homocysteine methyltransferase